MHITKQKKPIKKGYILYDSNCMTFWKKLNYGDGKKVNCHQGQRGETEEQADHRGFLGL